IDAGTLDAGDSAFLVSGGNTLVGTATISNLFDADATGSFTANTLDATDIVVDADSAVITTATAGDSLAVTTVKGQVLNSLTSLNDTTLTAGTDITLNDATSTAGNLNLDAGGNIDAGTLDAGDSAFLVSGGNTLVGTATIANLFDAEAMGSFTATTLDATDTVVDADSADITTATAGDSLAVTTVNGQVRSEERRVGNEWRSRWTHNPWKKSRHKAGVLDLHADRQICAGK